MDVGRIVLIQNKKKRHLCRYYRFWNGIPIFVAQDDNDTMSALYEDGTSFIILGAEMLKMWNAGFICNRIWHEVAHLYYKDCLEPWHIKCEFRADLVASAATGREVSLKRLQLVRDISNDPVADFILDKRLAFAHVIQSHFSKSDLKDMLNCLNPVTVL